MALVRHPSGEHTVEHRAALFLGPQALDEFHQQAESPARYEADPMGPRRDSTPVPPAVRQPRRLNAGSHLCAFIQAVQPVNFVEDAFLSSSGQTFQIHLQVTAGQVIALPLEVCQWLLAHQPGAWGQMTVIPAQFVIGFDSGTGLDTADLAPASGSAYPSSALPYAIEVYLSGGTGTAITKTRNGDAAKTVFTLGVGAAMNAQIRLEPGDVLTPTYTVAPALAVYPVP